MDMITTDAAKNLAVAYGAWCKARIENDDEGVCVWGEILITEQSKTGIFLVTNFSLGKLVKYARARLNEQKV